MFEISQTVDFLDTAVEQFLKRLGAPAANLPVGDPGLPTAFTGPVINDRQVENIDSHVKDAVKRGAELLAGGYNEGRLYGPTLLTGVTADMKFYHEQTFGPSAPSADVKAAGRDGKGDAIRSRS